jgi:hypothetical protein
MTCISLLENEVVGDGSFLLLGRVRRWIEFS